MPTHQVQSSDQEAEQIAAPAEEQASAEGSNSDQKDALRGKEGTASGLENYESALGCWLGGELYKAIAPELSFESMKGHGESGLNGAIKGAVGALGELEGDIDEAAIKKFGDALAKEYDDLAGKWLETEAGKRLVNKLGGWVDAHPKTVVAVALLAVAGAVLADMDIPAIKQKFKIADGLTAELEAKLGSLQNIALEEIKAKLEYKSGPLLMAVEGTGSQEGDLTAKASVTLGDEDLNIKADAEFTEDGLKMYGVTGLVDTRAGELAAGVKGDAEGAKQINAQLTRVDGASTEVSQVTYDLQTEVLEFKQTRSFTDKDTGLKASADTAVSSDGSASGGFQIEGPLGKGVTAKAGARHSEDGDQFSAGLAYKDKGLDAELAASVDGEGAGSVSGKGSYAFSDELSLSGHGKYTFGQDEDSYEAGAALNYKDDKNKFMASYDYKSEQNEHKVGLMGQRQLSDDFAMQSAINLKMSDLGTSVDVGAHGAYYVDKDFALIGGGRYQLDEKGESHFIPEIGAQVKGIPITAGYDTHTKSWTVGARIRF